MLDLGTRMKQYEHENETYLNKKEPVIIRLDGKAFHTFTKGFKRPFDEIFIKSMQETMKYLCENVENCVLGYQQSDEISLLLIDYKRPETASWFDYRIQKVCSVAASMATMAFNKYFYLYINEWYDTANKEEFELYYKAYVTAVNKGAMFDARCFNLPQDEVTNCFYWRQLDAMRNSVQMIGQANFSHKKLQNKSCNDIKEMLIAEKNIDFSTLPLYQQRGSCCVKETYEHHGFEPCYDKELGKTGEILCITERSRWIIDTNVPIFKDNREYINQYVYVGENNKRNE